MSIMNENQKWNENFSPDMGVLWLKIGVVYFVINVVFGLIMSIKGNFQFASVHSHIGLMGWVSLALTGMIYCLFPNAGKTKLGWVHFGLFNISLPILLSSLFLYKNGVLFFEKTLAIASVGYVISIFCFAINVFMNLRTRNT